MYLIGALFFWLIGITMLLKPDLIFQISESWKHSSNTEPSKRYLFNMRCYGVVFLLAGVLSLVVQFMK